MVYLINKNINRKCKDLQGGISKIWLLPFIKYKKSQIKIINNNLFSFPSSNYYLFETFNEFAVNQTMQENEGGKFYNFSFELKIDDYKNAEIFLNKEFRAVVLDRNNNTRMFGLYNGITCESINKSTGSAKAEFSGLSLNFSGQEILEAPFLSNIEILDTNFILKEDGSYLLQENLSKFIK